MSLSDVFSFKSANNLFYGNVQVDNKTNLLYITGQCYVSNADRIGYIAASPSDKRQSYMGTDLPFANPEIAYDETVNKGEAMLKSSQFKFSLKKPNSYYVKNGTMLIEPHVHISAGSEYFDVPLGKSAAYRSLTSIPGQYNRVSGR